jgi:2-dehydro-3-deoxyphosphogluconate aldolase/(4S)-4-hydroxy-2-oxoglutarate aldolase
MRSKAEIISALIDPGIIAVVRTQEAGQVLAVCEALLAGGVIAIEVTLTVPDALEAIRLANERFGNRALLGVGTVLNPEAARSAVAAGAQFVVSPITRLDLIEATHAAGKPVMIGAYTPTEAQLAHEAGADFVKIFPADKLGPGYIRNLRAPLPHLRIVPTGGVDLNTAADFLKAGCVALGVGSSLVSAEILRAGNWSELARLASEFVRVVSTTRAGFK